MINRMTKPGGCRHHQPILPASQPRAAKSEPLLNISRLYPGSIHTSNRCETPTQPLALPPRGYQHFEASGLVRRNSSGSLVIDVILFSRRPAPLRRAAAQPVVVVIRCNGFGRSQRFGRSCRHRRGRRQSNGQKREVFDVGCKSNK